MDKRRITYTKFKRLCAWMAEIKHPVDRPVLYAKGVELHAWINESWMVASLTFLLQHRYLEKQEIIKGKGLVLYKLLPKGRGLGLRFTNATMKRARWMNYKSASARRTPASLPDHDVPV